MAFKNIHRIPKKLKMTSSFSKSGDYLQFSPTGLSSVASTCSSSSSVDATSQEIHPAHQVPVFQLPRNNDLNAIPEDSEIHEGFIVNISSPLHHRPKRIHYSGLNSLANPDSRQAIRRSPDSIFEIQQSRFWDPAMQSSMASTDGISFILVITKTWLDNSETHFWGERNEL